MLLSSLCAVSDFLHWVCAGLKVDRNISRTAGQRNLVCIKVCTQKEALLHSGALMQVHTCPEPTLQLGVSHPPGGCQAPWWMTSLTTAPMNSWMKGRHILLVSWKGGTILSHSPFKYSRFSPRLSLYCSPEAVNKRHGQDRHLCFL